MGNAQHTSVVNDDSNPTMALKRSVRIESSFASDDTTPPVSCIEAAAERSDLKDGIQKERRAVFLHRSLEPDCRGESRHVCHFPYRDRDRHQRRRVRDDDRTALQGLLLRLLARSAASVSRDLIGAMMTGAHATGHARLRRRQPTVAVCSGADVGDRQNQSQGGPSHRDHAAIVPLPRNKCQRHEDDE
jgi:hypothetical protein